MKDNVWTGGYYQKTPALNFVFGSGGVFGKHQKRESVSGLLFNLILFIMKDFNSIRKSLLKEASENPKAFATAGAIGSIGVATSVVYASTLTTTTAVGIVKASVLTKVIVGAALTGIAVYGSYKLYEHLKSK